MASLLTSGYFARSVQLGSLKKTTDIVKDCQPNGHMWLVLGLPLLSGVSYDKEFLSGHICLAARKLPIFPEGHVVILLLNDVRRYNLMSSHSFCFP